MSRPPNEELRSLVAQAQWTYDNLARAVNAVAAEAGVALTYDRSAVAHWLAGRRPRGEVPAYVAEALARRLHRPVNPADAGFTDTPASSVDGPASGDPVAELAVVARHDLDAAQVRAPRRLVYRVTDLDVPARPTTIGQSEAVRPAHSEDRLSRHVAAITSMTSSMADIDASFGGAHARTSLVTYVLTDVAIPSRASSGRGVAPAWFAAASACVQLVGFMCFDSHQHGLALAYFRLALRLANAGGHAETYAAALRDMSVQAWSLGHHQHAARLAYASADCADSEQLRALASGQAAVAAAAAGDQEAAQMMLLRARRSLEEDTETKHSSGTYRDGLADIEFHTARVLEYAGDLRGAIAALDASLRHRPETKRRSRALTTAHLAALLLNTGQLGAASGAIDRLLGDHAQLHSARVDAALSHLHHQLMRHRQHPEVARVLRRTASRAANVTASGHGVT
ncbi:hypothetical protein [Amycolatopsis benzoatilytica]|uniref:hypothetical protein n=1 Tax=Amycolatopsis benzoatilytica TaxID=346045 RepID=UPI00037923C0|nr:hypothetical protein [Amycolatopsis benzoatilytica]